MPQQHAGRPVQSGSPADHAAAERAHAATYRNPGSPLPARASWGPARPANESFQMIEATKGINSYYLTSDGSTMSLSH
ncbi:hypothetical protein ACVXHA_19385 [Escherichia coli]